MNILKNTLNFLAFSNIIVGVSAVALVTYIIILLGYSPDGFILTLIFFSTIFGYNFQRKISLLTNNEVVLSKQAIWTMKHEKLHNFIIILSFIISIIMLYQLPFESIYLILPLTTLSLLYVLRIGNWPALRNIPFLKVFVVAFVWGGIIVLLPVIYKTQSLSSVFSIQNQLLSLSLALFIFGQSLPFDIRDIQIDGQSKLTTIPRKIGVLKTLKICWFCLSIAILINLALYVFGYINITESISFVLAGLSTALLLLYLRKARTPLFYSILLESCLMLPLIYYGLISWLI